MNAVSLVLLHRVRAVLYKFLIESDVWNINIYLPRRMMIFRAHDESRLEWPIPALVVCNLLLSCPSPVRCLALNLLSDLATRPSFFLPPIKITHVNTLERDSLCM